MKLDKIELRIIHLATINLQERCADDKQNVSCYLNQCFCNTECQGLIDKIEGELEK